LVEPILDDAREALGAAATRLRELDDKRALAWMLNRWACRERGIGAHETVVALASEALRAALTVEARSEAAIAASELMAAAREMADDGVFAEAEQTLAELESSGELSLEARERIASLARSQTT
jgi:hypothetical protein